MIKDLMLQGVAGPYLLFGKVFWFPLNSLWQASTVFQPNQTKTLQSS